MVKIIALALLAIGLCAQSAYALERSQEAKDSFKYSHPCPSNGHTTMERVQAMLSTT
jgi:hypothetical protein